MTRRMLARRLRSRLQGERGFTIVETVVAMTVIFGSLTALAYTATIGFRYIAYGRDRIEATGTANEIMEEIRGLAYTSVTRGMSSTDLTGDPRIVNCSGVYRFESCSGERIVSSSGLSATPWLVPHEGSRTAGKLEVDWATYVTNDDPNDSPYAVTVIVEWSGGAISQGANNIVRLESEFWSPTGCISSATHPFAAPCQPYFYGNADVASGTWTVTGQLHDYIVDWEQAVVSLPSTHAQLQQEQIAILDAGATQSRIVMTDSTGDESLGGDEYEISADGDPSTALSVFDSENVLGGILSSARYQDDPGGLTGLRVETSAADSELITTTHGASGSDPQACPPSGVAQLDDLACAGGEWQQGGTIRAIVSSDHSADIGTANLFRMGASPTASTALVQRDTAPTGYDGSLEVTASRTLGTIQIGGFPTSGMTAPAGMSTDETADDNYCLSITGFTESVSTPVGYSTSSGTASVAGTVSYLSAGSYLTAPVTDSALNSLSISCYQGETVNGQYVEWEVEVLPTVGGGLTRATTSNSQTVDTDSNVKLESESITNGLRLTVRYSIWVDGVEEVGLTAKLQLNGLLARGLYGPAPI